MHGSGLPSRGAPARFRAGLRPALRVSRGQSFSPMHSGRLLSPAAIAFLNGQGFAGESPDRGEGLAAKDQVAVPAGSKT